MTPTWQLIHGDSHDLGYLPSFFLLNDPRPAAEQLSERYAHGGGWLPLHGFEVMLNTQPDFWRITYPGDPAYFALAYCQLREEKIILFEHEWLMILQPDGSWGITRVD